MDDKEIYYNIDGYNIFCNSTYGPCFGKGVVIYDNNSEIEERCMDESHISFDTKGKQYALAGCLKFFVEDIDVWRTGDPRSEKYDWTKTSQFIYFKVK